MSRKTQLTGAFGERAAETELLRRGWLTANINAGVKNAADYDLIAIRAERIILLRIKTTTMHVFQFGCHVGQGLPLDLPHNDYSILVHMGNLRSDDLFYVMPTTKLRQDVNAHRDAYLSKAGNIRIDVGM